MARLRTRAKRKVKKALFRVEKKILLEIRRMLEQQRLYKAQAVNKRAAAAK